MPDQLNVADKPEYDAMGRPMAPGTATNEDLIRAYLKGGTLNLGSHAEALADRRSDPKGYYPQVIEQAKEDQRLKTESMEILKTPDSFNAARRGLVQSLVKMGEKDPKKLKALVQRWEARTRERAAYEPEDPNYTVWRKYQREAQTRAEESAGKTFGGAAEFAGQATTAAASTAALLGLGLPAAGTAAGLLTLGGLESGTAAMAGSKKEGLETLPEGGEGALWGVGGAMIPHFGKLVKRLGRGTIKTLAGETDETLDMALRNRHAVPGREPDTSAVLDEILNTAGKLQVKTRQLFDEAGKRLRPEPTVPQATILQRLRRAGTKAGQRIDESAVTPTGRIQRQDFWVDEATGREYDVLQRELMARADPETGLVSEEAIHRAMKNLRLRTNYGGTDAAKSAANQFRIKAAAELNRILKKNKAYKAKMDEAGGLSESTRTLRNTEKRFQLESDPIQGGYHPGDQTLNRIRNVVKDEKRAASGKTLKDLDRLGGGEVTEKTEGLLSREARDKIRKSAKAQAERKIGGLVSPGMARMAIGAATIGGAGYLGGPAGIVAASATLGGAAAIRRTYGPQLGNALIRAARTGGIRKVTTLMDSVSPGISRTAYSMGGQSLQEVDDPQSRTLDAADRAIRAVVPPVSP